MLLRLMVLLAVVLVGVAVWSCNPADVEYSAEFVLTADRLLLSAEDDCPVDPPIVWAAEVVEDHRLNFDCSGVSYWNAENILGGDNGSFVSLGPVEGNYLVARLGARAVDGPGADLVMYEIGSCTPWDGSNNTCEEYSVYLSDDAVEGFQKVAGVNQDGKYCIDLAGTGVSGGWYVKIVQDYTWETSSGSCATYGADFDAVGVLNVCPPVGDVCAIVGELVDLECPPGGDYKNHGAYISCVARTATMLLQDYADCFSEEQLDEIHGCIVSQRANTNNGKKPRSQL